MMRYSFIFLLIALVAGLLGTGAGAGASAIAARFCFVAFSVLLAVSVLAGLAERGTRQAGSRAALR